MISTAFDRVRFVSDLRWLASQNVPWLHQGSDPKVGVDCVGAPKWAYQNQGLMLNPELDEAFSAYHRPPNGKHMIEIMRKHLIEIPFSELKPGDLLNTYVRRNPCHLMIKMDDGEYAEAFENLTGQSSFRLTTLDPARRIAACFRIPG